MACPSLKTTEAAAETLPVKSPWPVSVDWRPWMVWFPSLVIEVPLLLQMWCFTFSFDCWVFYEFIVEFLPPPPTKSLDKIDATQGAHPILLSECDSFVSVLVNITAILAGLSPTNSREYNEKTRKWKKKKYTQTQHYSEQNQTAISIGLSSKNSYYKPSTYGIWNTLITLLSSASVWNTNYFALNSNRIWYIHVYLVVYPRSLHNKRSSLSARDTDIFTFC